MIIRISLFAASFLGFINYSMAQKTQRSSKGHKPELINIKRDFVRLSDSEKMGYFALFDEKTKDSVLISKDWISNNPEKINIIDNSEIYINTYSQSILVSDNIMVDSILIATIKRFPRPFRPQKLQNSEITLEVESFRIIEFEENSFSEMPKKCMELCFNRKFSNEDICVMFYFEFKSGEKWRASSGRISKYDINQGNCLYEEITDDSDRLGHSYEDRQIIKRNLNEDNIKSLKVEIYDKCWVSNYEKGYVNLISSKEIK